MAENQQPETGGRYIGALLAVGAGIPIPILATFITLLAYFALSDLSVSTTIITFLPLFGLFFTIIVWLLLAFFFMPIATAKGGKLSDYELIQRDLMVLKTQLEAVKSKSAQSTPPEEPDEVAIAEIQSNIEDIESMLKCNGLTWVMRTGYINLWNRINKADEAMIDILPPKQVIEGANYDILKLTDSTISDNKDIITNLKTAISTLSSGSDRSKQSSEQNQDTSLQQSMAQAMLALLAERVDVPGRSKFTNKPLYQRIRYSVRIIFRPHSLHQDNPAALQQSMERAMLALIKHAVEPTSPSTATKGKEQEARSTIRQVRSSLHKFTNERWDALVRARNQLLGTALLASIITYILVVLGILAGIVPIAGVIPVPESTLEQIIIFYLLGAIVGLFSRLLDESNAKDSDIAHKDDYGLTAARILVTPLLSGLAALVGVLLTAMLSITLTTTVSHVTTSFPPLRSIYNFNIYPQNLVFAAVFGYLPSLVIGILKQQTNKIQSEIHSSSPAA
jgi:hypothetical protein